MFCLTCPSATHVANGWQIKVKERVKISLGFIMLQAMTVLFEEPSLKTGTDPVSET